VYLSDANVPKAAGHDRLLDRCWAAGRALRKGIGDMAPIEQGANWKTKTLMSRNAPSRRCPRRQRRTASSRASNRRPSLTHRHPTASSSQRLRPRSRPRPQPRQSPWAQNDGRSEGCCRAFYRRRRALLPNSQDRHIRRSRTTINPYSLAFPPWP
jgi:hypothetical protein